MKLLGWSAFGTYMSLHMDQADKAFYIRSQLPPVDGFILTDIRFPLNTADGAAFPKHTCI